MLKDLVIKNRSVRGFDPSFRVNEECLMDLVDCARLTPSTMNLQPLKYHLIYEENEVKKALSLVKFAAALKDRHLPYPGKEPAAFIIICHDLSISPNTLPFQKDVGIAAQTMLLAASEKGLGGCMIANFNKDEVKNAFGLAENLEVQLVIALGKPDEKEILVEISEKDSISYYRDENDLHYVPKRRLKDILI
ncbi:MAG: nitroreductase family protein [Treponemataceae bacterium]|nr:nitroreductase family protein [Treponemataceae bacterium]